MPRSSFRPGALIGVVALGLGLATGVLAPATSSAATTPPKFDHIVLVMEENHSFSSIIGSSQAPYINSLPSQGALFTNSFAIEHPSEPNYLDIFSGSNQGITDDSCPHTFSTNNLGNELRTAGLSYSSFSEDLPSTGSTACTSGNYARKHNPSVNFSDLPTSTNLPFTSFPTTTAGFASLPTVSLVDPNLQDDMHDGTIQQGDTWLQGHMDAYAQWAKTHNSLMIVTWDEDDNSASNQVPTLFVGAGVTAGSFSEQINHFSILRTIEDAYGLGALGSSAQATAITDVFGGPAANTVTVTNPGNQTGTVGTAASVQVNASDSASGQTLTFSATGLPAGLSISSSGLITGTPTTAATSNVTVTATDSTNASGSTSFTWTIGTAAGNIVTVANPGNQTTAVGTAVNLTISGSDNVRGQSLTFTATGLPAGLSINSTTGVITGTPTTAGTSNVTVTATDTTNASGSTSFTWTITGGGGGCAAPGQKLANPGLESGSTGWSATSGVIGQNANNGEPAHTGTWDAWLDGYGTTHTDTLSQSVTIPAGCHASLSFWLHIDTAETSKTTAFDKLTVQLGSTTLATFSNLNAASGYTLHTIDVSSFAGQTVTLLFTGKEDFELQTSFVLDDLAVTAS